MKDAKRYFKTLLKQKKYYDIDTNELINNENFINTKYGLKYKDSNVYIVLSLIGKKMLVYDGDNFYFYPKNIQQIINVCEYAKQHIIDTIVYANYDKDNDKDIHNMYWGIKD